MIINAVINAILVISQIEAYRYLCASRWLAKKHDVSNVYGKISVNKLVPRAKFSWNLRTEVFAKFNEIHLVREDLSIQLMSREWSGDLHRCSTVFQISLSSNFKLINSSWVIYDACCPLELSLNYPLLLRFATKFSIFSVWHNNWSVSNCLAR